MAEGKTKRSGAGLVPEPAGEGWKEHQGDTYRCQVYVAAVAGRVVVTAATLPGLFAQGGTEQEALENIRQALAAAIGAHRGAGQPIPWVKPAAEAPPDAEVRWVIVYLGAPEGNGQHGRSSWVQHTEGVCGGDACIRNTRYTVWGLVEWRQLGLSDERILQQHPDLTLEDLQTAWAYYERHTEEVDRAIRANDEA